MKSLGLHLLSFAVVLLGTAAFAQLENQFLNFSEAEKLWNLEPFDAARFKTSSGDDRAGMALDLINHGTFTNKKLTEVRASLGAPDGRYPIRASLAYRLGSDDKNQYQLIFLPDFSGKLVENVKILHEPLESTPVSPLKSPTAAISAQPKRLPIRIDGPIAESIFKHLKSRLENKSTKTGQNIACAKEKSRYHCSFEIDEDGVAFAK